MARSCVALSRGCMDEESLFMGRFLEVSLCLLGAASLPRRVHDMRTFTVWMLSALRKVIGASRFLAAPPALPMPLCPAISHHTQDMHQWCVFRAKVATDSGRTLPPIPVEGCH